MSMRVSTPQIYSNQQRLASLRLSDYVQAQRQVATGKKIEKLSDDAIGAVQLLKAKSYQRAVTQFQKNLGTAKDFLSSTASTLDEMNTLMNRANTLAISGANSSNSETARKAMADEIASIQQQFIRLANAQNGNGQYIFAGQKTDAAPYSDGGGVLNYAGDTNNVFVETAPGQTMKINTPGGTPFQDIYNHLQELKVNLEGGNLSALSGISIPNIQNDMKSINLMRGDAGNNLRSIDALTEHNSRRLEDLASVASDIEDVDMVEAVSNLQKSQVAYQAALQVSAQTYRLSLLDFM